MPELPPDSFGPVTPYYDALMSAVPYASWVKYLERLWLRLEQQPRSILDLACGTGTVSCLLSQRGYSVTGVDLSAGMLQVARQKAEEAHLPIEFYRQDAADLDLEAQRFDAALCLFDSLNYILEPARLQLAFARVSAHLSPGGSFLFDVNTEVALAEGMFNQSCTRREEPLHYRWRSRYDPVTRLCTVHMRFSYDPGDGIRQTFVEVHRQRAYGKEEMTQWLRAAGFGEVFVYNAYSTDPPYKNSDRLFYVAVKPK